ncbi:MAG: AAA family ATPase [Melioribacteraceae bacterium]|nr:AAA family ATPase [Melioribacteraceae bacterium]
MALQITLKGNTQTNEYKDALKLKEIFEKVDSQFEGNILIHSNATLFGQKVKDVDLIVLAQFTRSSMTIQSASHSDNVITNRKCWLNNFCFCIETKHHNPRDIRLQGTTLSVKYSSGWSDTTTQSEEQKYSLKNFFEDRLGYSPYIYNFIWLCNLTQNNIDQLTNNYANNYLPSEFTFQHLIEQACIQRPPFQPNGKDFVALSSIAKDRNSDPILIQKCFDLFEGVKIAVGELTRKKIEYITNQILNTQQYAKAIGNELVVISGRAGTGKTIKILRIACDLALNSGRRCLILTYNHALASDIQRMLALIEIPDTVDGHTVNIMTLHKFFYELILGFGISTEPEQEKEKLRNRKHIEDYISNYEKYLDLLIDYINSGLIEDTDIQDMMLNRYDTVNWDYILIDESQDWEEREKEILYRIFTPKRLIIADGVDQLIRSQNRCNWIRGVKFTKTTDQRQLLFPVNDNYFSRFNFVA